MVFRTRVSVSEKYNFTLLSKSINTEVTDNGGKSTMCATEMEWSMSKMNAITFICHIFKIFQK